IKALQVLSALTTVVASLMLTTDRLIRRRRMEALMRRMLVFSCLAVTAWMGDAQTIPRKSVTKVDTGDQYAYGSAGNKKRIRMRVWVEETSHSDGSVTYSLNYDVAAEDRNAVGNWKVKPELANIAYSIRFRTTGWDVEHADNMSLKYFSNKTDVLFDGFRYNLDGGWSFFKVSASRYGGPSGIEVSVQYP